jgi:thiamine biosynthesis lipoprotein
MTTLSRLRLALGTFVAVEAEAQRAEFAQRGINAAFAAISLVERIMHPTRPGSDLAALRANQRGAAIPVHEWTWEVLELCQALHVRSHGVFDPCLSTAPGRMTDLELLPGHRVRPRAVTHVDLGGVAKGYAADRAIAALRSEQCEAGLVNAGGDLAVFGARARQIVCRGPHGSHIRVELQNAGLATCDTRAPAHPSEHRGYYHGVHREAAIAGHATIIASRAAIADALTKCVLADSLEATLNGELLRIYGATQLDYASELQSQAQVEA